MQSIVRLPAGFKSHLPATVIFQTSRVDSSKSWNDGVCGPLLHTCTHMWVCLFPAFIWTHTSALASRSNYIVATITEGTEGQNPWVPGWSHHWLSGLLLIREQVIDQRQHSNPQTCGLASEILFRDWCVIMINSHMLIWYIYILQHDCHYSAS